MNGAPSWLAHLALNPQAPVQIQAGEVSTAHPANWPVNGYLEKPREGKLWTLRCHSDCSPGLLSTTGSKADEVEMSSKGLRPCAAKV